MTLPSQQWHPGIANVKEADGVPFFPSRIDRGYPRGYCRISGRVPSCLNRRSPMRTWTGAVALALVLAFITLTAAQPPGARPDKDKFPAPGTTGNPDNVPFI